MFRKFLILFLLNFFWNTILFCQVGANNFFENADHICFKQLVRRSILTIIVVAASQDNLVFNKVIWVYTWQRGFDFEKATI